METKLTQKILIELKDLISNNEEIRAIEILKEVKIEDYDDELTILKSNLNEIKINRRKGIQGEELYRIEKNKILNSLLSIINDLQEKRRVASERKFNINLIQDEEELKSILEERLEKKYEISDKIHSGDRSIIFKVFDKTGHEDEKVLKAIKIIKPFSILREENLKELHYDIRNLEQISSHDGIISIYDRQIKTYPWYFIMQYIKGKTISEYIASGWRWRIDEILKILLKIIDTVRICHQHRIIHGDLRPHEIILNREEENSPIISPFRVIKNSFYIRRTSNRILWNCMYMSPEELNEGQLLFESDQFSIGLIAYEMLEGKPLYGGENVLEVINKRMQHKEAPDFIYKNIKNKECPKEFIEIIDKMLKYDSKERFDTLRKTRAKISRIWNNEVSKIGEDALMVQGSYDRCRNNPLFFKHFYENFFKKNKVAEAKFTNIEKQYEKLDMTIERIVGISRLGEGEIMNVMTKLAEKHANLWDVRKDEYDIFMEQLLFSIRKFDEKKWGSCLEEAWRNLLGEGVRLMKNYYK